MTINARTSLFGAAAAAALLLAGPAQAQQEEALAQDEVESYFNDMSQQVTEMAETGDFEGLIQWIEDEVAEEARFYAGIETYAGEERKSFSHFMLDKQDMVNLGQISFGLMAGIQGGEQVIDSYELDIDVLEVVPAGPDAATVRSRMVETATFSMPDQQAGTAAADEAPGVTGTIAPGAGENGSLTVEATAECTQLIRRSDDGDQLLMGLTACDATANF